MVYRLERDNKQFGRVVFTTVEEAQKYLNKIIEAADTRHLHARRFASRLALSVSRQTMVDIANITIQKVSLCQVVTGSIYERPSTINYNANRFISTHRKYAEVA